MKTITLIYESTGDEYRLAIPMSSNTETGIETFDGEGYHDFYQDMLDDLYTKLNSPDFAFRTFIYKSLNNNPSYATLGASQAWAEDFWNDIGSSVRYGQVYNAEREDGGVLSPGYDNTSGVVAAGMVGSSMPIGWYYLKGADAATRRYLKWDGLNFGVYENNKTTSATGGFSPSDVHLSNGNSSPYFTYASYLTDWNEFKEASSVSDLNDICYTVNVKLDTVTVDLISEYYFKLPWRYNIFAGSQYLTAIWSLYQAGDPDDPEDDPPGSDDPYNPYDPSGPGGPKPPHNPYDPGDPINIPAAPGYNPTATGMMRLYVPTDAQVQALATRLWDNTFWTVIQNFIADPRDVIISLGAVPFSVVPTGYKEIYAGSIGTGVDSYYLDNPYIDIDCGSVYVPAILGGYTDFSPYTQIMLTLPYVGSVQLDTDIFMANYLQVKYRVDVISGNCIAFILCDNKIKAQYNGNMKFTLPLTSADYAQVYGTFIGMTTGAVLGAAGAAAAGAEAGAVDVAKGAIKGGVGKLSQTAGIKPNIQVTGDLSSNNGLLGVQKPFIEIKRPNLCIPEGQQSIEGYPALFSGTLGNFHGYTEVEEIHLAIPGATQEELEEIEARLKTGVIL